MRMESVIWTHAVHLVRKMRFTRHNCVHVRVDSRLFTPCIISFIDGFESFFAGPLSSIVSLDTSQTSWRWRLLARPRVDTYDQHTSCETSQSRVTMAGLQLSFFTCKSLRFPASSAAANPQPIQNPHLNAPAPVVVRACRLCRSAPDVHASGARSLFGFPIDFFFLTPATIRDLGKSGH